MREGREQAKNLCPSMMNFGTSYYSGADLSWKPNGKKVPPQRRQLTTTRPPFRRLILEPFSVTQSVVIVSIKVKKMLELLLPTVHKIHLHVHYWLPWIPRFLYITQQTLILLQEKCFCEYPVLTPKLSRNVKDLRFYPTCQIIS